MSLETVGPYFLLAAFSFFISHFLYPRPRQKQIHNSIIVVILEIFAKMKRGRTDGHITRDNFDAEESDDVPISLNDAVSFDRLL